MYKTIVSILLLAAAAQSNLVGWRNCGSPLATIHRVRVDNCTATPCLFRIGELVKVSIDAAVLAHSVNIPFVVSAIVFGLPIRMYEGNVCDYLTYGECPVLSGREFTAEIYYQIMDDIPIPTGIPVTARTVAWNDFGDVGVCIDVDGLVLPSAN